ncbi:MAG: plastocyanin/azurin family copper-binding protein [Chloroflexi bacterium]|nr:plastocyanin/azurin family copper-binding protein [Chloroflexota bacterium]
MTVRRLLLVAAMALEACAPSADPSPVATTTVDLPRSYRFAPPTIQIPLGATVTWTNSDNFTHSIEFDGDPAPGTVIAPGESTARTFGEPGTFAYLCAFHPQDMYGTVLVTIVPGSE